MMEHVPMSTDVMSGLEGSHYAQHYRTQSSMAPTFTDPFATTAASAPIISAPTVAFDDLTPRTNNLTANHGRRYSNPYNGVFANVAASQARHMSVPNLFFKQEQQQPLQQQTEMMPATESFRNESTIVTSSSGTSPTSASFAPVAAYQQFLAVPQVAQHNRGAFAAGHDRRMSQPNLPSNSFSMGSPLNRPRQHSMYTYPPNTSAAAMTYSGYQPTAMSTDDFSDTLEAGRGIVAMSHGMRGHPTRSSADSTGYYTHHSAQSSISSNGPYPTLYNDNAADMSSPEAHYDSLSQSMPNPSMYVTNTGEDARSMMHRFNSRPPTNSKKNHVCRICGKTFARPSSLTTHTYSHTGQKPFKCDQEGCGKKFNVVSNLRRHYKVHKTKSK